MPQKQKRKDEQERGEKVNMKRQQGPAGGAAYHGAKRVKREQPPGQPSSTTAGVSNATSSTTKKTPIPAATNAAPQGPKVLEVEKVIPEQVRESLMRVALKEATERRSGQKHWNMPHGFRIRHVVENKKTGGEVPFVFTVDHAWPEFCDINAKTGARVESPAQVGNATTTKLLQPVVASATGVALLGRGSNGCVYRVRYEREGRPPAFFAFKAEKRTDGSESKKEALEKVRADLKSLERSRRPVGDAWQRRHLALPLENLIFFHSGYLCTVSLQCDCDADSAIKMYQKEVGATPVRDTDLQRQRARALNSGRLEFAPREDLVGKNELREKSWAGLPFPIARQWASHLLNGLQLLHEVGYIHTDLKPANLFVEFKKRTGPRSVAEALADSTLMVGDLDTVCRDPLPLKYFAEKEDQARGTVAGRSFAALPRHAGRPQNAYQTPYYRAPEMYLGAPVHSTAIDIWSTGVILTEFLCGVRLFNAVSNIASSNTNKAAPPDWLQKTGRADEFFEQKDEHFETDYNKKLTQPVSVWWSSNQVAEIQRELGPIAGEVKAEALEAGSPHARFLLGEDSWGAEKVEPEAGARFRLLHSENKSIPHFTAHSSALIPPEIFEAEAAERRCFRLFQHSAINNCRNAGGASRRLGSPGLASKTSQGLGSSPEEVHRHDAAPGRADHVPQEQDPSDETRSRGRDALFRLLEGGASVSGVGYPPESMHEFVFSSYNATAGVLAAGFPQGATARSGDAITEHLGTLTTHGNDAGTTAGAVAQTPTTPCHAEFAANALSCAAAAAWDKTGKTPNSVTEGVTPGAGGTGGLAGGGTVLTESTTAATHFGHGASRQETTSAGKPHAAKEEKDVDMAPIMTEGEHQMEMEDVEGRADVLLASSPGEAPEVELGSSLLLSGSEACCSVSSSSAQASGAHAACKPDPLKEAIEAFSDSAEDLALRCCLSCDPKKRWTAADLLGHPFFKLPVPTRENAVAVLGGDVTDDADRGGIAIANTGSAPGGSSRGAGAGNGLAGKRKSGAKA